MKAMAASLAICLTVRFKPALTQHPSTDVLFDGAPGGQPRTWYVKTF